MDYRFKTEFKFVANSATYQPHEEQVREARASLQELKLAFPDDITPQTDPDLVYVLGNLAVGGLINLNDDGITTDTALSIYKKFEKKQCNVEHDRTQVCGFILKAFLTEFGTNRVLTEDEARISDKPFNISTLAVVWRVVNKELAQWLEENTIGNDPSNQLSLSFEVGFDKYQIVELSGNDPVIANADKIVLENSKEFASYDAALRQNGGSGKKNGNQLGRLLTGEVVPLGQGIVTNPAAAVKGLITIDENPVNEQEKSVNINMEKDNAVASPVPFVVDSIPQYSAPAYNEIKSYLVALPTDWKDHLTKKFASLAMKDMIVDVSTKDGYKVPNVPVYDGKLNLKELLDKKVIISIEPSAVIQDSTNVDNSPAVHPNIDKIYPTVDEKTQKADEEYHQAWLKKEEYTDAIIKNLQTAAENINKNCVLIKTENITMDITKLQSAVAALKEAKEPAKIQECVASLANVAAMFADEIARKSEELSKASKDKDNAVADVEKKNKDLEAAHSDMEAQMKAVKEQMKAMQDMHLASEAERKFNDRMGHMDATFDFTDEEKAMVAEEVMSMSDDHVWAKYFDKSKKLMKEKTKVFKQEQKAMNDVTTDPNAKRNVGTKDNVDSEDEAIKAAIASAKNNPIHKDVIVPSIDGGKSLKETFAAAFKKDFKIGGRSLADLEIEANSKKK